MGDKITTIKLQDGTLVRHRVAGYEGRIEGTTEIKACFTRAGAILVMPTAKETFQYRVAVIGESMRHIAPADDLEIMEAMVEVVCLRCHITFRSKPGLVNKAGGRCECGGWICPACFACQAESAESSESGRSPCLQQRKRLVKKLANKKRASTV